MHPPHGRTRGGPARRLKITPRSRFVTVWKGAVRLHHRVRGGQTPDHRPTVTMLSLVKVPLTVLSLTVEEVPLTGLSFYIEAQLAYVDSLTEFHKVTAEIEGLQLTGGLNPASIGTAIQSAGGGSTGRQRALLNQVQQNSSRQLLNAAQIAR